VAVVEWVAQFSLANSTLISQGVTAGRLRGRAEQFVTFASVSQFVAYCQRLSSASATGAAAPIRGDRL